MGQNAYILFYKRITPNLKTCETIPVQISNGAVHQQSTIIQKPKPSPTFMEKPAEKIKETAAILAKILEEPAKTNGHVNGQTNGNHLNGHTNGYANVNSNGHVNGLTNGHTNGLTNGTTEKSNNKLVDLSEKILKKKRLIKKLSKKLKKKQLKRLKKKLTRIEAKRAARMYNGTETKSETSNPSENKEQKQETIFLKKKRELRLLKKMIHNRKVKRLNNSNLENKLEKKFEEETSARPATSAKKNESFTEIIGIINQNKLIEAETKTNELNILTTKTNIITWGNEESSLLKKDQNRFDHLSEEEQDEYNEEFDKPVI